MRRFDQGSRSPTSRVIGERDPARIALVEVRDAVCERCFASFGFSVVYFASLRAFMERQAEFHAVIVAVSSLQEGLLMASVFAQGEFAGTVAALAPALSKAQRLRLIAAGIECIDQPAAFDEVAVRVRLHLRRLPRADIEERRARRHRELRRARKHLGPTEFRILMLLVEAEGRIVGYERMAREALRRPSNAKRAVHTAMARVRRQIAHRGLTVTNVSGKGYFLEF